MPRTVPASLLLVALAAAPLLRADGIRVAGTDLLGPDFPRIAEDWAVRSGTSLEWDLKGTRPGIEAARAGRASVALFLLPPDAAPPGDPLTVRLLGWQVTVVAVSATAPLRETSLPVLRARCAGGRDGASGVRLLALAPETGLAWAHFRAAVLAGEGSAPSVEFVADRGSLAEALRRDETALAVADAGILTEPGLRPLALAGETDGPAFLPGPESLLAGRYPLQLGLWVAVRRSEVPRLMSWLRFVTGDEAAQALARAGFMPLPAGERARLRFEFEEMR